MTRLVVDTDAFAAHLKRLQDDGNIYIDTEPPRPWDHAVGTIMLAGPAACDHFQEIELILLMSDALALTATVAVIRERPSPFWAAQLASPLEPFVTGDRDDRAAARLYELRKLIPF